MSRDVAVSRDHVPEGPVQRKAVKIGEDGGLSHQHARGQDMLPIVLPSHWRHVSNPPFVSSPDLQRTCDLAW